MRLLRILGAATALAAVLAGSSGATAVRFVGTTTQLTTNPAVQTDPSISGDIVVFTDNRTGDDNVFYVDLATGTEVQVTFADWQQQLHDVSGNTIVYSDLTPPAASVVAYDVTSATRTTVAGSNDRDPRIDGNIVVFERGPAGATDVVAVDLSDGSETVVTATAAIETNPVVSGTRIVYERRAIATDDFDVVLYELATGTETVLAGTAANERRPDIDGDTVVYDLASAAGDTDIAIHDLASGTTTVLGAPGNQSLPHVSDGFVAYDHEVRVGNNDVYLRHVATGETVVVASNAANDQLNDLDGNRVVYTSNVSGNFDIWAYEFTLEQPDIDVAPGSYDFGDVNVGSSATTVVTVSNVGQQPLVVSTIALAPSGGAFAITAAPALPATIAPGATVDVQLAFAPTATGPQSATLVIESDDLDEGTVEVVVAGRGVQSQPPPEQQVADILSFFDTSVSTGTLAGSGPGKSAPGRLNALRNMIEAAGDLVRRGLIADACQQLADARNRADGDPQPPDFVTGRAAAELRDRIDTLRATLGCG